MELVNKHVRDFQRANTTYNAEFKCVSDITALTKGGFVTMLHCKFVYMQVDLDPASIAVLHFLCVHVGFYC